MSFLSMVLKLIIGELFKILDRPDRVLTSPVPVLEEIDCEDPDAHDVRLLTKYRVLLED